MKANITAGGGLMLMKAPKPKPRLSVNDLWNCTDPAEWDYCEGRLYDAFVKPENREVERELEKPGLRERIAQMTTKEFYDFLRDEYFKWKFTSKPKSARQARAWPNGPNGKPMNSSILPHDHSYRLALAVGCPR
jgi:hypothetical protein